MSTQEGSPTAKVKRRRLRRILKFAALTVAVLMSPIFFCVVFVGADDIYTEFKECPPSQRWALRGNEPEIVFTSNRDGNNELYIMNADGANQTNLTNNPADDHGAVVSPDGTNIAFTSNRTGNFQIFVMNIDGSHTINISGNTSQEGFDPTYDRDLNIFDGKPLMWSTDSKQVTFGTVTGQFFRIDADGNHRMLLSDFVLPLHWLSPDGKLVAFLDESVRTEHGSGPVLAVEKPDGSGRRVLTDPAAPVWGFEWSMDSNHLAYNVGGFIKISTADGSNTRVLWQGGDGMPKWSGDGRYLAFSHYPNRGRDAREEGLEHYEIYVLATDGSARCLTTTSLKYDDRDPIWIPSSGKS